MRRFAFAFPAALLVLAACGPKKYVLLSPEEEYSDDPSLSLQVEVVQESVKGRTEIVALVENKGTAPLAINMAEAVLLDSDEKAMPLLAKPEEGVEPGQEKKLLWAFDTTNAKKGALEMHLKLDGKKIWPILFSADKPSDFKAPPPGGPEGGMGPPGGGRPPF